VLDAAGNNRVLLVDAEEDDPGKKEDAGMKEVRRFLVIRYTLG
jgi:hypothetical protein